MKDYKKYYHLESYLFNEVHKNFQKNGELTVEEFFCIIIWKANRAKSNVAKRIKRNYPNKSLSESIKILSVGIHNAISHEERLRYLMKEWGFNLPMATAILTVLYPDFFTVYDIRVCSMLGNYHKLLYKINFENIWKEYEKYRMDVEKKVKSERNLRDKDRWLWGKSFYDDLKENLREWDLLSYSN